MRPRDNPSFEGTDSLSRVIVGSFVSNRLRHVGSAESSEGGFCGSSSSRGRACGRHGLGSRSCCERGARLRPRAALALPSLPAATSQPVRAVRRRRVVLHAEEQRVRERLGRLDVVRRSVGRRGQRALVRERCRVATRWICRRVRARRARRCRSACSIRTSDCLARGATPPTARCSVQVVCLRGLTGNLTRRAQRRRSPSAGGLHDLGSPSGRTSRRCSRSRSRPRPSGARVVVTSLAGSGDMARSTTSSSNPWLQLASASGQHGSARRRAGRQGPADPSLPSFLPGRRHTRVTSSAGLPSSRMATEQDGDTLGDRRSSSRS